MSGRVAARLKELGIMLPHPAAPQANYVPWVISGTLLFVSGQITAGPKGLEYVGTLGKDLSVADGQRAARLAALNSIAQASAALGGDLDRVARVIRLAGFVASTPDFTQHPEVVNGASDLMRQVFGDAGQHTRIAVGCPSLPRGIAVEIEALYEIA
jgi:enamine deaminase RidA (YjgF/YER057c/UK114 family)